MMARLSCLLLLVASCLALATGNDYPDLAQFLQQGLGNTAPEQGVLWHDQESRAVAEKILGHPVTALRQRYYAHDSKTAWVLDEIGKERPITVGVVISQGKISHLAILAFRESRGWEVRLPYFARQFLQRGLTPDLNLNGPIDNITGATLSVNAVRRVARLALYLDSRVSTSTGTLP